MTRSRATTAGWPAPGLARDECPLSSQRQRCRDDDGEFRTRPCRARRVRYHSQQAAPHHEPAGAPCRCCEEVEQWWRMLPRGGRIGLDGPGASPERGAGQGTGCMEAAKRAPSSRPGQCRIQRMAGAHQQQKSRDAAALHTPDEAVPPAAAAVARSPASSEQHPAYRTTATTTTTLLRAILTYKALARAASPAHSNYNIHPLTPDTLHPNGPPATCRFAAQFVNRIALPKACARAPSSGPRSPSTTIPTRTRQRPRPAPLSTRLLSTLSVSCHRLCFSHSTCLSRTAVAA